MTRLVIGIAVVALGGIAAAQNPHAQKHHAAKAQVVHKAAPIAGVKAPAVNGTDAQLKALEQKTAKIAAGQQKQKVAPVKFKAEPAGAKKNPPIVFKGQHAQKQAGKAVPAQKVHAKH